MKILISGAGVAGGILSSALDALPTELYKKIERVDVVDRNPNNIIEGFGFLLLGNGVESLKQLGLWNRVKHIALEVRSVRYINARVADREGSGESGSPFLATHMLKEAYALPRQSLLYTLGRPDTITAELEWNASGPDKEEGGEFVVQTEGESNLSTVNLKKASTKEYDIVAACEGYMSQGRQWVNNNMSQMGLSGTYEIVGVSTNASIIDDCHISVGHLTKYVSNEKGFAFSLLPLSSRSVIWYVQVNADLYQPPATRESQRHLTIALLAKFECLAASVISEGVQDGSQKFHFWRGQAVACVDSLARENVFLLGDAARVVLPFTSQGLNLAIEDVVALMDLIKGQLTGTFDDDSVSTVGSSTASSDDEDYGPVVSPLDLSTSSLNQDSVSSSTVITAKSLESMREKYNDNRLEAGRLVVQKGLDFALKFRSVPTNEWMHEIKPVVIKESQSSVPAVELEDGPARSLLKPASMAILKDRAFNLRWAQVPEGVIPLTAADPDFLCSESITSHLQAHIADRCFPYAPNAGTANFRKAVARDFGLRKKINTGAETDVDASQVIACNSAASALKLLFRFLLEKVPGQRVLIPDPVDFLIPHCIALAGGEAVRFPMASPLPQEETQEGEREKTSRIQRFISALDERYEPDIRFLALCHPHNPLGIVFCDCELAMIAQWAQERDIELISDEVWSDVVYPAENSQIPSHSEEAMPLKVPSCPYHNSSSVSSASRSYPFTSMRRFYPRTWVAYGFSKGFAMAGFRIGALICPSTELADDFVRHSDMERTTEGVSSLSQEAGVAALTLRSSLEWNRQFLAAAQQGMKLVAHSLNATGMFHAIVPEGTFVVWAKILNTFSSEELARRLREEAQVAAVPGLPQWFGLGAEGYIRFSCATDIEKLTVAMSRITQWCNKVRLDLTKLEEASLESLNDSRKDREHCLAP